MPSDFRIFVCAGILTVLTIYFTGYGQEAVKRAFTIQSIAYPEIYSKYTTRKDYSFWKHKHENPSTNPDFHSHENLTTKLILLWSPVYRSVPDLTKYYTKDCPESNCKVTADKKLFSTADAVLFEADSLGAPPTKRSKLGQVWVLTDMESPAYRGRQLTKFNNAFNWTITYRRDSDIPFYYGYISKNANEKYNNESLNSIKTKTPRMLWMVSHCTTPSKREVYVKELQKYIGVDVIGRCGTNNCNREQKCQKNMLNRYKFYFGAENADCRDYITEKAYRTLMYPILPVLRGGYNDSVFLPPSSYLDAHKFSSAKDLANFMKALDGNGKSSGQYFMWKKDFISSDAPTKSESFCLMCKKLQNQNKFRRLYRNIDDWWSGSKNNSGNFCSNK